MAGRKQAAIDRLNRLVGPRSGLWLRPLRPGLPNVTVDDPRLISYAEMPAGVGVAFRARLDQGALHNFALGQDSVHPWVVALRRAGTQPQAVIVRQALARYYDLVQPANAAEWLDVPAGQTSDLTSLPPAAGVFPWSLVSPEEALSRAQTRAARERRGYRLRSDAFVGSPSFGPMAPVQVEAEADKLCRLATLLSRVDLDPLRIDYDLGATVLVDGDRYRWFGNAGRHRIAVMCALGAQTVELAVRAVVRRDEVDLWPLVSAGRLGRETALQVFDRLMAGDPPGIALPWVTLLHSSLEEREGS